MLHELAVLPKIRAWRALAIRTLIALFTDSWVRRMSWCLLKAPRALQVKVCLGDSATSGTCRLLYAQGLQCRWYRNEWIYWLRLAKHARTSFVIAEAVLHDTCAHVPASCGPSHVLFCILHKHQSRCCGYRKRSLQHKFASSHPVPSVCIWSRYVDTLICGH